MAKILVTGGTGFLGAALIAELAQRAHAVCALVRPSSRTEALDRIGVPIIRADFESSSLASALPAVDAVVHCVGGGRFKKLQDLYTSNLETTRALLDALRNSSQRLQRFVLVSSLSGHGPSPGGRPRPDDAPTTPVSHYGRSKALAEELVLEYRDEFPVTILRPPAIYGPGDTRMLPLFRATLRGAVPLPGPSRRASMLYIDDCVSALIRLLEQEHASGQAFSIDDGQPHEWEEVVRAIASATGGRERIVRIPMAFLNLAAIASETLGKLRSKRVFLTRDKLRDAREPNWICDSSGLQRQFDWQPAVAIDEGMSRTAAWYRSCGLL